jgi:very-short-patch-repair endonuclease
MTGRTQPLAARPELTALARRQHGVLHRTQLAAAGFTRHHVRHQLVAQRWRQIGPNVLVLHTGPLTRDQQFWLAHLHGGHRSALGGLTALELDGLRGWSRTQLHLTVPTVAKVPPLQGLVVHRTRTLSPDDVVTGTDGLVRTSVARSTIDAARWEPVRRRACGLVVAVVQQRLASVPELLACLDGLERVRHASALREALADAADGADSVAESDVARLITCAGLPRPRRQVVVMTAEGPRRVDLAVELPDGRTLVVEVDGPHHADPRVRLADSAKDSAVIAAGDVVVRVPAQSVRTDAAQLTAQFASIRAAAERRRRTPA